MEAMIFSPANLAALLMLRLVKEAARSSAITWSTVVMESEAKVETRNLYLGKTFETLCRSGVATAVICLGTTASIGEAK